MASSWEIREGFVEEQVFELDLGEWKWRHIGETELKGKKGPEQKRGEGKVTGKCGEEQAVKSEWRHMLGHLSAGRAHPERLHGGHTWPRMSHREPGLRARLLGSFHLLPFPPCPLCAWPPHLRDVRRE